MDIIPYIERHKDYLSRWSAYFKKRFNRAPQLRIIQTNQDERSNAYVRSKLRFAAEIGVEARVIHSLDTIDEPTIIQAPSCISFDHVPVELDVDGLSHAQQVLLDQCNWEDAYFPATAGGIVRHIQSETTFTSGKTALVIGRSNLVGKPLCKLLRDYCNMTVISAHSHTPKLEIRRLATCADYIIVAVGKKHWFHPNALRSDVKIYDVGINVEDGKLYGDVHPDTKSQYDCTPVPKGVGLLTVCELMHNTLKANERKMNHD